MSDACDESDAITETFDNNSLEEVFSSARGSVTSVTVQGAARAFFGSCKPREIEGRNVRPSCGQPTLATTTEEAGTGEKPRQ